MNCQQFNDRLYDYLDDALGIDERASVCEHLQHCADCEHALRREKAVARSIRHSLDRATASISIRPEVLRKVLGAWDSKPTRPSTLVEAWHWFIDNPVRPVSAGAAFLGVLVLFAVLHAHNQPAENAAARAVAGARQIVWVIDVPIQTETHVFRRRNGTVVDSITPSVAFGHARFQLPENSSKSL